MIQTRHGEAIVEDLPYQSRHPSLPVETFDLDELRRRAALDARPVECLQFHLVMLCTDGFGHHLVDFTELPLAPQRILHLRPGQVHRWRANSTYRARLVLFPDPGRASSVNAEWFPGDNDHTVIDPDTDDWRAIIRSVDEVVYEQRRFDGSTSAIATMSALLEVLLCRISLPRSRSISPTSQHPIYVEFRRAIEHSLGNHPEVADIARRLGYSTRTIDRACHAATGRTGKQILDGRLVLEAQRLLAHTDDSLQQISYRLGFTEATNFTKFIKRNLGLTPSQFRSAVRTPDVRDGTHPNGSRSAQAGDRHTL